MYAAMGPDVLVTARTIDVHVAAIRKKLGDTGATIRTVRGVGYMLGAERSERGSEPARYDPARTSG
jgi:DNA-binding response OmpR family regulator